MSVAVTYMTEGIFLCLCRLHESYEALSGGLMSEALTDMTGGIVERFELGGKTPADLQTLMLQAFKKSSLMGCSIDVPLYTAFFGTYN